MPRPLRRVADALGVLLFSTLFCVFIVQVVARFFFNHPMAWTDELAVVLYIWVILWATAFMVPHGEHVKFDLVYGVVSPRVRRAMRAAGCLLIGGLFAWALPANWDYIHFMGREGTPVLGISFMWVFLPFAMMLGAVALRSARQLIGVLRHEEEGA